MSGRIAEGSRKHGFGTIEKFTDRVRALPSALSSTKGRPDVVLMDLRRVVPTFRRLNIEILGNTDAFLHCHIWPRYEWEPPEIIGRPVWLYDAANWRGPRTALGPAHVDLRAALLTEIEMRRDADEFRFSP